MRPPGSDAVRRNQAWWESLGGAGARPFRRPSPRDGAVKLFAFTCGWLSADMGTMLGRETGRVSFPVPAYVIEHPKGCVLFDTGMHPDSATNPAGRLGRLFGLFEADLRPGEDIRSRLEKLDIDAGKVEHLVISHLHFDHSGGSELVPNARMCIQRREWESGHIPEMIEANGYNPKDYDHGHLLAQVDGEHDFFGDGAVVTIPTHGHTPGHQSLKVRLASGGVVLAADACHFKRTLEELHLPGLVHDRSAMIDSLLKLRRLRKRDARIFPGHDPEFWKGVPQAPLEVR